MKRISCIVDNCVQRASDYWGEHGLCFLVEIDDRSALFDTGGSETVLLHNLDLLDFDPSELDALVLSHSHTDHTGGLVGILSRNPGLPLFASPHLFEVRYSKPREIYKSIGITKSQEQIGAMAKLQLTTKSVQVIPGLWTTGMIMDRSEPEGRSAHHFVPDGDGWKADPYLDDLSLVMETGEGLVVILGCCHAGLLNTLVQVRTKFQDPIVSILGGTHLVAADVSYLHHVADVLKSEYDSPRLYLNHCTGERALVALAGAFGSLVSPCPVGTVLAFD